MKSADRKTSTNMDCDTKEEPEVIILDEEECPFTIITVKIGENGTIEETNDPVINLDPQMHPTYAQMIPNYEQINLNYEQVHPKSEQVADSSETDNSDDWADDVESPVNAVPIQPKTKRKRKKGPHMCPHCGKVFGQRLHLNDHIMTHTGEKPFKCLVCNRGFIQRSNLITHLNQRHPSEAPLLKMHKITQSFNCWDCKRSFSNHHDYRKHMKAHTKAWAKKQPSSYQLEDTSDINPSSDSDAQSDAAEITYSCAFCDQEYPDEESLASHMNCHTAAQSPDSFICEDSPANTEHHKEQEDSSDEFSDQQSPESFTCKYCGKRCTTQLSLSYHERTHRIKRTFRCSICRRGFDKRQAYDRHIRKNCRLAFQTDHKTKEQNAETFNCIYCGKQCDTKLTLSYHERTHRIQRTFHCSLCNRGFNKRQAFERHKTEHRKEEKTEEYSSPQSPKLLSCKYCGKQCTTDMSLSYHERTHKIKRLFRCSICRRGFNSREAYDRHIKIHSARSAFQTEHQLPEESGNEYSSQQSTKSFSCKYCGKRCTTEMNLSYHERTHRIKRTFRCSFCKRGFHSRQAYDRHLTKHCSKTAVQTEHQKLEESGGEYSNQGSLKSFSCKYCGKRFNKKLSLSYHERTHKIQRTFRCPICNRGFDSEQAYDRHIKNHSKPAVQTEHQQEEASENSNLMNPESFNCKYCGKQLNSKLSLSYHERTHRIKRTFRCHICRRGFDSRPAYDRHLRKHQKGEESGDQYSPQQQSKPFSCLDCGARFSTEQSLLDHEKSHSNQRTFICSVCNRGFNRRQTYDRHIKLHSAKSAVHTELKKEEKDEDSVQQSPESFSCKYCGKQSNTKVRLSYHERTHKIKRTFRCSICNSGFNSRIVYDQHLRKHSSQTVAQTEPQKEEEEEIFISPTDNHSKREPLKLFSCDKCGVRFRQKQRLLSHMKCHTSDTAFCCKFCNKMFSTKAACIMHMKSYTVEMPFSCSVCDEKFKFPGRLAFHMRTHGIKDFKPHSCTVCDNSFGSNYSLNLHMARFHKGGALKPFSCKDCGETFRKRLHLLHHQRSHKRSFRCSVCKKGFNKRQAYDRHLRLHSAKPEVKTEHQKVEESGDGYSAQQSPTSFSCKDCGKHFSKKSSLECHLRMHNIKLAFSCPFCKKRFSRRQTYEEHITMHSEEVGNTSTAGQISNEEIQSNIGEIIFSCPLCDKELQTEQGLKAHMDEHEKNDPLQPFSCVKCGAGFQEKQWLESHMEVHNADTISTFCCNICNETFGERSKYESHMRIHTEPRPFSSTVCNKKFNRRSKLEEHARVQKGGKPVSCPVCLQKFSCNSSLKRHLPLHEGEDKLSLNCEDCGKRYSSKLGLFYHRRTHNIKVIQRTYRCPVCNMRFAKKLSYDWHVRMHCPKPAVKTEPQEGHETNDPSPAFSCEDCGAKFSENVSWLYHKRTHKRNAFSCSICQKGFGKREVYELHMKTHAHEEANESDMENKADLKELICHLGGLGRPTSETTDTGLSL